MANDYSINLKAVLDSTQVQRELQKLRQQQQGINSTISGNRPDGSLSNNGLGSVFNRLNASISNLQKSVDHLARMMGNGGVKTNAAAGKSANYLPVNSSRNYTSETVMTNVRNTDIKMFQKLKADWQRLGTTQNDRAAIYQAIARDKSLKPAEFKTQSAQNYYNTYSKHRGAFARILGIDDNGMPISSFKNILKNKDNLFDAAINEYNEKTENNRLNKQEFNSYRRMMKLFGGQMIAGTLQDADLSQYGISKKWNYVANASGSALQEGMTGGIAAGMLGAGPAGVVALALTQAVASITKSMVEYANSISRAQAEATHILKNSRTGIKTYQKDLTEFRFNDGVTKMSHDELKTAKQSYQEEVNKNKEEYLASDIDINKKIQEINADYLTKIDNPELSQIDKTNLEAEHAAKMNALNSSLQSVKDKYEESQKKLDAINAEEKKWENNLQNLNKAIKDFNFGDFVRNIKGMSIKDIASEADKSDNRIKELRNQYAEQLAAKDYSPEGMTKLQNLSQEISEEERKKQVLQHNVDTAKSQGETVQDMLNHYAKRTVMNNLKSELLDPNFNDVSNRLDEARARRKEYGEKAITALNRAKDENITTEKRDELINEAKEWQGKESDETSVISLLEDALVRSGDKYNYRPDMSGVTSLASMGFNMGEKDSGLEDMKDYWDQSLTVQKQIKQKLDEGITSEASYQ